MSTLEEHVMGHLPAQCCGKYFSYVSEAIHATHSTVIKSANHIRWDLPLLCTHTAITCFSHRHFHQAAEAATLDLLRPTVCESDTVSLLCHTEKLNIHTNNWVSFQHGPWHFCLTHLNITGHPEAWDSSPPEAVNLIWAAALYFIARAYIAFPEVFIPIEVGFPLELDVYVPFSAVLTSRAPSNQMYVWWTRLPHLLGRTFLSPCTDHSVGQTSSMTGSINF